MAKKTNSKDQMTFQFTVKLEDLMSLEGGSSEELSDFERGLRLCMRAVLDDVAKREKEPLDRIEVAARMSRLLGREVTKSRIDEWVAMSTVGRRIHVDALKAFCDVTANQQPVHYFCEANGLRALTPDLALCAEFGATEIVKSNLNKKQKAIGVELEDPAVVAALFARLVGGKS